jgi:hypothetical protein
MDRPTWKANSMSEGDAAAGGVPDGRGGREGGLLFHWHA